MGRIVKPLREIIDSDIKDIIAESMKKFSCRNPDVENFLRNKAWDFERRSKSRTYLIIDSQSVNIIGYYTLSLKPLTFNKTVSKSVIQKIDGFSREVESVAVILIGQFGKDKNLGKALDGVKMLEYALNSIYEIQDRVGGRVCLLETEDSNSNKKVIDFYKKNDFRVLQRDRTDKYLQLFRVL